MVYFVHELFILLIIIIVIVLLFLIFCLHQQLGYMCWYNVAMVRNEAYVVC
jgi:hypothetical protein